MNRRLSLLLAGPVIAGTTLAGCTSNSPSGAGNGELTVTSTATECQVSANSAPSGLLGKTDGTVTVVDPATGATRVVASGLTMPNGLALLPDGRAVTSTVLGPRQGIVATAPGGAPVPFALRGEPVNGLWFDGASGRLWASTATTATTRLYAIDPEHPDRPRRYEVPGFGPGHFADDLTVDAHTRSADALENCAHQSSDLRVRCTDGVFSRART